MQRTFTLSLAALFLTAIPAIAGEKTVTLAVENMTCASCPYIVEQTLAGVAGVIRADVSFEDKSAIVTFDDARASPEDLTDATASMGFPSSVYEGNNR